MAKGGARPGAGRPKGRKDNATLEREKVEAAIRQRIMRTADKLITSQMNLAKGVQMLFKIETTYDKNGNEKKSKPQLVDDQKEIEEYLAGERDDTPAEYYFMTTEKPNNQALDSLLDRTFGKATNKTEITGKDGEKLEVVSGFNFIKTDEKDSSDNKAND